MAVAKRITDNHLTCVICREVFTDPATLQCNHTFCKSCLLKYTKTQPGAIQARSIPCPSCRQLTRVATPDRSVDDWVNCLKPSHVIQGLIDDLVGSQDLDVCGVCKRDGDTTPATMLCTICDDVFCDGCVMKHNRVPRLRDHKVIDLRNRKPKVPSSMCRIHKDEKIKLFCKDCWMAICTVCCSINHRKCYDVETIDVMTPLVKETRINQTRNQLRESKTYTEKMSSIRSDFESILTIELPKLRRSLDELKIGIARRPLQTIDCSRQGHTYGALNDVAVLTVHGIKVTVVTDNSISRLHACYTSNKTFFQKCLDLPTGPSRVAKVGGALAAVTLPASRQIAFINFDPEPSLLSTVKTKKMYYGLACLNSSQLVAGGNDSRASVDVLDMKGNVLKSINTGVIKNPFYIHVTRNNNLLVSEWTVKSLVSVTSEGKIVFTYTPTGNKALKYPGGITSTSTGDILLVDSGSNRVIQLTESGQFVRDVFKPLYCPEYPVGIYLDDDGLLYVSSYTYVKVFRFE
ncbi:uncharacterized protein [Haliotis cracherodii]|uniref:uncharacterized protein n=1 Tax=Haliotis cracherodii TaxID=6455 RepID=UPI0039EA827F